MPKFEQGMEAMLDMFVFETSELLEKLDDILMRTEESGLEPDDIGEIFRIMHTVKGSAAMMGLQNMSGLAHSLEDLFSLIREDPNIKYDKDGLYALLYEGSDGLKAETENLSDDSIPLTDFTELTARCRAFAQVMQGKPAEQAEAHTASGGGGAEIYSPEDGDDVRTGGEGDVGFAAGHEPQAGNVIFRGILLVVHHECEVYGKTLETVRKIQSFRVPDGEFVRADLYEVS